MLERGEVSTRAELARRVGASRSRVTSVRDFDKRPLAGPPRGMVNLEPGGPSRSGGHECIQHLGHMVDAPQVSDPWQEGCRASWDGF